MDIFKRLAPQLLALMMVIFFVVSLLISFQESTTMDEKAHIPAGYSYVKYKDMRINPEHPPLLKDLAGLPLFFLLPAPIMPQSDPLWESGDWLDKAKFPEGPARTWGLAQWAFGDKILHENGNDANAITFWARFPLIFVSLLLGFFIYRWTRELAGTVAGLFAVLLYFFNPNIIAHSHYVTTDVGIAAFIFIAFYYFVRFLRSPSWKNTIIAGIFLGLAQLAKFSAVLLFPIFGLFTLIAAIVATIQIDSSHHWKLRLQNIFWYGLKFTTSIVICFIVIWMLYVPNTWNMPGEVIAEIARAQFPNDRAVGRIAESTVIFMSQNPALKPLAEYFLGLFMVFARVAGGNTYYFLGTVSNQASSWYFPVVFLLKETLPMLFLIVATSLYTLWRAGSTLFREGWSRSIGLLRNILQERLAQSMILFFVLFYSYVSITGNLNIGFRHLFPILPFLYVLVAKVAFDILKRSEGQVTQKLFASILGIITLVTIAIPALAYPSYLSYFNPIGGGHKNGYQYVTDSNYDWGQDLKRLGEFVRNYNLCVDESQATPTYVCHKLTHTGSLPTDSPINQIRVDYFGGSNPRFHLGEAYIPWHSHLAPESGWYAISIGFLQENWYKEHQHGEQTYAWLKDMEPIARVGDSIFVYYKP